MIGTEIAPIELRGVSKSYGDTAVLRGVDLTLTPGEIHALVGLNGAGKTTIMRLILAMTRPDEGSVDVRGTDVAATRSGGWSAVGHVVDAPLAYPELTVEQNLNLAGRLNDMTREASRAAAVRVAEELRLTRWWSRRARTLSQGNRQRLGLGAALIHEPSLLVLDEPTSALDPSGVVVVREALVRRARNGTSVLVSSHHLDEVARIADRVTVINDGRIIGSLEPDEPDIERRFFALVLADAQARA
jgi:ABC-2 type transport system ATP-binding protein